MHRLFSIFLIFTSYRHVDGTAPFLPVWKIIGILSLAQASWGIYVISYTGLVMNKKTFTLSCLEIGAGLSCILWNALLIPKWHMEGAAIATLLVLEH